MPVPTFNLEDTWKEIEADFDTTKNAFGRKINFVSDPYKRSVIFRDVAQAYALANAGFNKPAIILAGSVLEELLRLYLESKSISPSKDTFDQYIRLCEENGLLKSAVHRLTDSVRQFRNLVHMAREVSRRETISKPTAKGAVTSIFTISNDFGMA
jgi:hypothetical protein